jgi:hypothetical protein
MLNDPGRYTQSRRLLHTYLSVTQLQQIFKGHVIADVNKMRHNWQIGIIMSESSLILPICKLCDMLVNISNYKNHSHYIQPALLLCLRGHLADANFTNFRSLNFFRRARCTGLAGNHLFQIEDWTSQGIFAAWLDGSDFAIGIRVR